MGIERVEVSSDFSGITPPRRPTGPTRPNPRDVPPRRPQQASQQTPSSDDVQADDRPQQPARETRNGSSRDDRRPRRPRDGGTRNGGQRPRRNTRPQRQDVDGSTDTSSQAPPPRRTDEPRQGYRRTHFVSTTVNEDTGEHDMSTEFEQDTRRPGRNPVRDDVYYPPAARTVDQTWVEPPVDERRKQLNRLSKLLKTEAKPAVWFAIAAAIVVVMFVLSLIFLHGGYLVFMIVVLAVFAILALHDAKKRFRPSRTRQAPPEQEEGN